MKKYTYGREFLLLLDKEYRAKARQTANFNSAFLNTAGLTLAGLLFFISGLATGPWMDLFTASLYLALAFPYFRKMRRILLPVYRQHRLAKAQAKFDVIALEFDHKLAGAEDGNVIADEGGGPFRSIALPRASTESAELLIDLAKSSRLRADITPKDVAPLECAHEDLQAAKDDLAEAAGTKAQTT